MTTREIILEAFRFLQSSYGFEVVRESESPLRAYVVFKRGDVKVTVEFDGRMSDVLCEFQTRGHKYFAAFDEILAQAGEKFDAVPATTEQAIQRQLRWLADKTEQYAAPALKGDATFYELISSRRK